MGNSAIAGLGNGGDMILGRAQTITAPKTFNAGTLICGAGTVTDPSYNLASGTLKTSVAVGDAEFNGVNYFQTIDTTSGRGIVPVEQFFRLTATGSTVSSIANYFGTTSNISLVANAEYEIEVDMYFLKTTAGTVTWTLTNSSAPTSMNWHMQMSAAGGLVTTAAATYLFADQYNLTSTAPTFVTASLTNGANHHARFKIFLRNGSGTSLKIQATCSAGSITPGIGSYWKCRRLPNANIGTFAA